MNKRTLSIVALFVVLISSGALMRSDAQPAAQGSTPEATIAATQAATAQPFTLLNLNTTDGNAFLAIPDMSNRMVREYLEYRPYTSILQFRKEIGKYVGDQQTAAWEKYIYVPILVDEADAETLKQIPGVTDQIASDLIAAQPFGSNEAFLTKLSGYLTADQVTYAANYLDGTVNWPAATPVATAAPTAAN